ncbi:unnamed protein product, partial [Mesorhabditis spiculigera]
MPDDLDETRRDGVLSPGLDPRRVEIVVVVGPLDEHLRQDLLESGIQVIKSQNGSEYVRDDVTFIISDFTSQAFNNLVSCSKDKRDDNESPRIMAPVYAMWHIERGLAIPLPQRHRPRYCCSMKNLNITMEITDESKKKELINKIHWMSGSVRKELRQQTTHFVTDSMFGENYRNAVALGYPILRYTWVLEAWTHCEDLDYDANTPKAMEPHVLRIFEGLRFYFCRFDQENISEMRQVSTDNGALMVEDPSLATHIVYGAKTDNLEQNRKAWHVSATWFWESISLGRARLEMEYTLAPRAMSKKQDNPLHTSKASILDNSNNSILSNDDKSVGSPCKVDKKQQIVSEMLDTERNYITMLELLLEMRNRLVGSKDGGNDSWMATNPGALSHADANLIFGKIPPILNVHKAIHGDIAKLIANWSTKASVADIWYRRRQDLRKVYPPFINTFDKAKDRFREVDRDDRFHAFVRMCESGENWRKQRVEDLLVRPIQRLPSILLLLQQCAKHCKKNSTDAENIPKTIREMQSILENANASRQATENFEKIYKVFDEIESMPAELRSSHRTTTAECVVACAGGTGQWDGMKNKPLRLLIFNDLLMLAVGVDASLGYNEETVLDCMQRIERGVFIESGREDTFVQHVPPNQSEKYGSLTKSCGKRVLPEYCGSPQQENLNASTMSCMGMRRPPSQLRKAISNTSMFRWGQPLREQQLLVEESPSSNSVVSSPSALSHTKKAGISKAILVL